MDENAVACLVIVSLVAAYSSLPCQCHVPFPQPGFLSTPAYIEGNLNETILIPCVVHDLGKNTLRWWKDGTLLSDSSDDSLITPPRITLLTNNMLLVDWLEPGDAGNYTCEIVRAYPRLPLEQVHTVKVRHPPQIVTQESQVEALLGQQVQIGCMATGWPTPVVTWKFKGEIMTSVDNRHKLKFLADDPSKSGVYTCEADNKVGNPASSSILLHILYPPEIKVEKSWVHSSPGTKTEIACSVTGEPMPKVEWLKEGERLGFDTSRMTYKVRGERHVVSFRTLMDTDFGKYGCKARNKVGEAEKNIELSGLAYPAVFKKTRGVVSPDSYSLIWEVDSYSPIIEYKLMFREADGGDDDNWIQLIIPADADSPGPLHSKSYTLSGLKLFTVYEARLTSRNRFGWSQVSKTIRFGSDGKSDLVEDEEEVGDEGSAPVSNEMVASPAPAVTAPSVALVVVVAVVAEAQTFPVNL